MTRLLVVVLTTVLFYCSFAICEKANYSVVQKTTELKSGRETRWTNANGEDRGCFLAKACGTFGPNCKSNHIFSEFHL